jgi:hypothetical protein
MEVPFAKKGVLNFWKKEFFAKLSKKEFERC